ncbi:MAG: hypothetical protein AAF974_08525 [Cyanobacteria bacterium P01_E01_bin.34]
MNEVNQLPPLPIWPPTTGVRFGVFGLRRPFLIDIPRLRAITPPIRIGRSLLQLLTKKGD